MIVRNPTHYAVALKYDMDHDVAPLVLAKGKDHMALRIVKVGEENKVLVKKTKHWPEGYMKRSRLMSISRQNCIKQWQN